jgi:hypothetical protein
MDDARVGAHSAVLLSGVGSLPYIFCSQVVYLSRCRRTGHDPAVAARRTRRVLGRRDPRVESSLPKSTILPYALVLHAVNFVPYVLIGAWLLHYNARHLRRTASTEA